MDSIAIAAGISSTLFCLSILSCCLYYRRLRGRRRPDRVLMIADCLQPHLVCKTVSCQHPYYRVITEYNNKTRPMPDIAERPEESFQESNEYITEPKMLPERRPRFYSQDERSKKCSLPGLPRRYSLATGPIRKHSSSSVTSSRRSSDASSNSSIPISPIYKTKPTILTQNDLYCQL